MSTGTPPKIAVSAWKMEQPVQKLTWSEQTVDQYGTCRLKVVVEPVISNQTSYTPRNLAFTHERVMYHLEKGVNVVRMHDMLFATFLWNFRNTANRRKNRYGTTKFSFYVITYHATSDEFWLHVPMSSAWGLTRDSRKVKLSVNARNHDIIIGFIYI